MNEIVRLPSPARRRFVWLLPLVFAVGAVLGSVWPGQGEQLFVIGSLAGVWACYLMPSGGEVVGSLLPTLVGGIPILLLFGRLLDRLRAELWLWGLACLLVSSVAGYVLLQGYGDFEAAIAFHGSFLAYCICALQLGSYGATLVVLMLEAGRGGIA